MGAADAEPGGLRERRPRCPSWATAPLCNRIEEKVSATLLRSSEKPGAGTLVLLRTPAARQATGASIGPRCLRTFHNIVGRGLESDVALTLKGTAITVPIPNLKAKLAKLAKGKRGAHPSFKRDDRRRRRLHGDDDEAVHRRAPGLREGPVLHAARALGSPSDYATASACMIAGDGKLVVTREGPAVSTEIPKVPR